MTQTEQGGEHAPRRWVRSLVAALVVATSAGAVAATPAEAQTACTPVELVVARETGSAQGSSWILGGIADQISSRLGGRTSRYDVNYPASADFLGSVPQGVTDLVRHLNDEAARCPDQRFVLLGYSQGAMVIGDALSAPLDRTFGPADVLSQEAASSVDAVVWFGDPRFRSGESFNAGSATGGANGVYPRRAGALAGYADRIRNYCNAGDMVCQGGVNVFAHISYLLDSAAQREAVSFAVGKVQG